MLVGVGLTASPPDDESDFPPRFLGGVLCLITGFILHPGSLHQIGIPAGHQRNLLSGMGEDMFITHGPIPIALHAAVHGSIIIVLIQSSEPHARYQYFMVLAGALGALPWAVDRAWGRARRIVVNDTGDDLTLPSMLNFAAGTTLELAATMLQLTLGVALRQRIDDFPAQTIAQQVSRHALAEISPHLMEYGVCQVIGFFIGGISRTPDPGYLRFLQFAIKVSSLGLRYRGLRGSVLGGVWSLQALSLALRRQIWRPTLAAYPLGFAVRGVDDHLALPVAYRAPAFADLAPQIQRSIASFSMCGNAVVVPQTPQSESMLSLPPPPPLIPAPHYEPRWRLATDGSTSPTFPQYPRPWRTSSHFFPSLHTRYVDTPPSIPTQIEGLASVLGSDHKRRVNLQIRIPMHSYNPIVNISTPIHYHFHDA